MIWRLLVLVYFLLAMIAVAGSLGAAVIRGQWLYVVFLAGTLLVGIQLLAWLCERWELALPRPLQVMLESATQRGVIIMAGVIAGVAGLALVTTSGRGSPLMRAAIWLGGLVLLLAIAAVVKRRSSRGIDSKR